MTGHLKVNADIAFNTSHAVSNEAEELREELFRLSHEWDNLAQLSNRDSDEEMKGGWV
jgi:hypothetical protein